MGMLTEQVALVTGAAKGLGRATALRLAQEGACVVVADTAVDEGEQVVEMIQQQGGTALFIATDVTRMEDVKRMVDTTVTTFGRLDCAYNNAGISGNPCPLIDDNEQNITHILDVNVTGIWRCMQLEIVQMIRQGGGAIVNATSYVNQIGFAHVVPYVASKSAVAGLTRAAALEYVQHGIRINAVGPGPCNTPMLQGFFETNPSALESLLHMVPMGRLGQPEEIAAVVAWLCSDQSSFLTGQVIYADGGTLIQ